MGRNYKEIKAFEVIEAMRQDFLKMDEGEEKEKLLGHIFASHSKLNEIFYREQFPQLFKGK